MQPSTITISLHLFFPEQKEGKKSTLVLCLNLSCSSHWRPSHLPQRAVLAVVVGDGGLVLVLVRKRVPAPAAPPARAGLLLPTGGPLPTPSAAGLPLGVPIRLGLGRHIATLSAQAHIPVTNTMHADGAGNGHR